MSLVLLIHNCPYLEAGVGSGPSIVGVNIALQDNCSVSCSHQPGEGAGGGEGGRVISLTGDSLATDLPHVDILWFSGFSSLQGRTSQFQLKSYILICQNGWYRKVERKQNIEYKDQL